MSSNLIAGFPPSSWLTSLIASSPTANRGSWPLTKFIFPGSHDACTWGGGSTQLTLYSWQCQSLNLYEQATQAGIRYFDIRIRGQRTVGFGMNFVGVHGLARDTTDTVLSEGEGEAGTGTFVDQILTFLTEQPGEIVILAFAVENTLGDRWVKTIANLLGDQLLPPRSESGGRLTYDEAVKSNRRIVLRCPANLVESSSDTRLRGKFWDCNDAGGNSWFPDDQRLYNDETWQSMDPDRVVKSIQDWATSNADEIRKYDKFWGAQFQMTPTGDVKKAILGFLAVGNRDVLSPKMLALGGIKLDGGSISPGFNATITSKPEVWSSMQQYASIIQIDWAGVEGKGGLVPEGNPNHLVDAIVRLNLSRE